MQHDAFGETCQKKALVTIAFIIPWFGRWPAWMRFTLESMRYNPDVHFLFFTDQESPENCPENVKMHKVSWDAYKNRISTALGIKFNPEKPYKLCDIKPALGHIHEADLQSYDFWGFCDIDLVFGQIRATLTDRILSNFDIFTTDHRRIKGHFTVIKNTLHGRLLYRKCLDWRSTFEDDANHHAFDEKSFSDLFNKFKNYPQWFRKVLQWVFVPLSRELHTVNINHNPHHPRHLINIPSDQPVEWVWNNGVLTNNFIPGDILYFHFLAWKNRHWRQLDSIDNLGEPLPSKWKITSEGFKQA